MGAGAAHRCTGKRLRGSVALLEQAQAAARHGKPLSEFLGWSEFDRHMAIALCRVEKLTGDHGEWLPDATSERADPEYYGDDAIRFRPTGPYTNQVVRSIEAARKAFEKQAGDGADISGMYWGFEKVEY